MKSFILGFLFAIGLMVMLPGSGSASPPGQSSFVVGHFEIAPAIATVQDYTFVAYQSQLVPVAIELREKGGILIEKSLNTSLNIGYSNKNAILKAPVFTLIYNTDFRLSYYNAVLINQGISSENIQSVDPVTIRADTQKV